MGNVFRKERRTSKRKNASIVNETPVCLCSLEPVISQFSSQGIRPHNEDALKVVRKFAKFQDLQMYGVFDGHNGTDASTYCYNQFDKILANNMSSVADGKDHLTFEQLSYSLAKTFIDVDDNYCATGKTGGCTAIVAILDRLHRKLVIGNIGDSRAVLARRNGRALALTSDHKPSNKDELKRIEAAGHIVKDNRVDDILGCSRAIGDYSLKKRDVKLNAEDKAISPYAYIRRVLLRIGINEAETGLLEDIEAREAKSEGEMNEILINGDNKNDNETKWMYPIREAEFPSILTIEREEGESPFYQFLVIACDGLFDVTSNKEVTTFINKQLKQRKKAREAILLQSLVDAGIETKDKSKSKEELIFSSVNLIAKELCEYALEKKTRDNVSIVIIFLDPVPQEPSKEEITLYVQQHTTN